MGEGYRKIFWGIFIATFNVRFGIVKILPAFVGFLVISNGINILIEETRYDSFIQGKKYSNILVGILFLGGILSLYSSNFEQNIFFQLVPVLYLTIELLLFYKVFEGSIRKLNKIKKKDIAKDYEGKLSFYIVASIINSVVLCLIMTFNIANILTALTGIATLILRIFLMTSMSRLKNIYLDEQNPEVN